MDLVNWESNSLSILSNVVLLIMSSFNGSNLLIGFTILLLLMVVI